MFVANANVVDIAGAGARRACGMDLPPHMSITDSRRIPAPARCDDLPDISAGTPQGVPASLRGKHVNVCPLVVTRAPRPGISTARGVSSRRPALRRELAAGSTRGLDERKETRPAHNSADAGLVTEIAESPRVGTETPDLE